MDRDAFHDKIQLFIRRIIELQQSEQDGEVHASALLPRTLMELQTALEELHVADEELRQQNEELSRTHHPLMLAQKRYQELFDFAPDAYLVTNTAGIIQEPNQAAQVFRGGPPHTLVDKPLVTYIAPDNRQAFY